jgi:dTDP-4-amino-4,6-dideoxygalactose transaminase
MRLSEGACPHLMVSLIEFEAAGVTRAEVMKRLREAGIGAQVHYIPVHRQPYYAQLYGPMDLPGAERYYARCLSLPLFPSMTEADVTRVARALGEALGLEWT